MKPVSCPQASEATTASQKTTTTFLSVIVPAYNNQQTIGPCLRAIRSSSYKHYELIVSDNGSTDGTCRIAARFADRVVYSPVKADRRAARETAIRASEGEMIVNIDSDIVVRPDALELIARHFENNPGTDALSGRLSKDIPFSGFFSRYKNLYMHYIFGCLPKKVTFLYGSVCAMRRGVIREYRSEVKVADDTALGQGLTARHRAIDFVRELEVVHLKQHSFFSLLRNDFRIPFDWAVIFMKYKGWKQLFRNHTGFAHSPKEQLASLLVVSAASVLTAVSFGLPRVSWAVGLLAAVWLALNARFFGFMLKEGGKRFVFKSVLFTLFDHAVMIGGILSGMICYVFTTGSKKNRQEEVFSEEILRRTV